MEKRNASPYSQGHTDAAKNVENFPEAYYDFDDSVVAVQEVPAAVDKILRVR